MYKGKSTCVLYGGIRWGLPNNTIKNYAMNSKDHVACDGGGETPKYYGEEVSVNAMNCFKLWMDE